MTEPVQILKSGMIYDAVTVKYLQQLSNNAHIDPITGVLISIGRKKPIVLCVFYIFYYSVLLQQTNTF